MATTSTVALPEPAEDVSPEPALSSVPPHDGGWPRRLSARWVGAGLGGLAIALGLGRARPAPLLRPVSAVLAVSSVYLLAVRPWHLRWDATDDEVRGVVPGDERVPNPVLQSTRAITIDAPSEAVWPWLAQMGWRRAGWYTYAILDVFDLRARGEPMFSGRLTDRIIPELQQPRVGQLVDPSDFRVARVDPPRTLVLEVRGGVPGIKWMAGDSTWVFAVLPINAHRSRLVERWRIAFPMRIRTVLFWGLVEAVDFVMQRAQLLHIKERAERHDVRASRTA